MSHLGPVTVGDDVTIDVTISPAGSLVGSTVTAMLYMGLPADPTFSITKAIGDGVTVVGDVLTIAIVPDDWDGFPARGQTLTLEIEVQRAGTTTTVRDRHTLGVLAQAIV